MSSKKSISIIRDYLFACADQIRCHVCISIWEYHAMTLRFHLNFLVQSQKPKGEHQKFFVVSAAGSSKTFSKLWWELHVQHDHKIM